MNESEARSAFLVRAYETLPAAQPAAHWTAADAAWATQAALQAEGENAAADTFIRRRAGFAAERICSREIGARHVLRALTWQPWIGWLLAFTALAAGIATDALASTRQINVLAPPLLALLIWNLAVYAVAAVRAVLRVAGKAGPRAGALTRRIAQAAHAALPARHTAGLTAPLAAFARAWNAASVPLTLSRVARTLHVAAIAFAAGTLAGMYLRGLALEYRAGWESTFLAAPAVHGVLSFVLGPASALTGIALPDVAGVAAIRFGVSAGENAARWIHLYAVTVTLFVLVPRGLLAIAARVTERRLAGRFPIALDDSYFQTLLRAQRDEPVAVHVVPYSHQPGAQCVTALNALAAAAFGAKAGVTVGPAVPFGGEDALDSTRIPAAPVTLAVALFPLTATPERENHGAFIEALRARLPRPTPLVIAVDEADFRQRFGAARLDQRRALWQREMASSGCELLFVDPDQRDANAAAQALRAAVDSAATPAEQA